MNFGMEMDNKHVNTFCMKYCFQVKDYKCGVISDIFNKYRACTVAWGNVVVKALRY